MAAYLARRVVQALFVVLGVTIIVFILLQLLPGGPARALLGPRATGLQLHEFIVANGYNKPVWQQYADYIDHLVHGNLGYSYHYNQTVNSLLAQDLPKSVLLVGLSYVVSLLIAIPVGILQAVRRNKPVDYALTGVSFVGYSMPVFWLGILLVLIFAVNLHLLPPEAPQGTSIGAVLSQPAGLILPVATLAIVTVAQFSRFMRSSAIENLVQDYIRTARSNGLSELAILFRHLLRNSLIPIITLIGLSLPAVLSGAVITESVFNYPGMGLLLWNSATVRDYPVLLGFTVVVGVATVAGSLLADVLYAVVDPRVRYS
ncbi:MAG TPA: ABC transporter permease [Streptosporangiaceae bacterium]|nr:ABC transporter permease [Streptosporangiaceae bacterium]